MVNILLSILFLIGNQTENKYLSSVQIICTTDKSPYDWGGLTIDKLDTSSISFDLETGWTLESQTLKLFPKGSSKIRFKVEIRYETSLTIMDEGPHLDLVDWKHYVSKWRTINEQSENTYIIPMFSEKERTRFPKATKSEIYDAVMKRGGARWSDLVRKVDKPTQYPCGVEISMYTIRISVWQNGEWITINEIEFNMAMGC